MRKVFTIAISEFVTALTSKAFLIGILLVPTFMLTSVIFQRTMGQRVDREDRRFAVVDHTGKLYTIVALAAEVWNARQMGSPGYTQLLPPANIPGQSGAASASGDKAAAPGSAAAGTGVQIGPRFVPSLVDPGDRPIEQVRLDLSERVARKELFAFVEIPANAIDPGSAPLFGPGAVRNLYHSNHPGYNALPVWIETVLNQAITAERLRAAGVDVTLLRTLAQRVPLDTLGLVQRMPDGQVREAERVDRIKSVAIPLVLMVIMFTTIMSSASPLLNSVMEEKMTRISEVLLGSVAPFQLMLGKLVGSLLVSLVLSAVYMAGGFGVATYWGYGDALSPILAGYFVIYLALAIMMFGAVFMAIGAACTDLKDAQGMMTPVMLFFVLPFLVWVPVMQSPDSLFSTIVSLIPVASPMLMTLRLSLQPGPPFWQVILSVVLTGATSLLFVWAAGKVFRTGILMQGKSASVAEMIRWVRA
jgi:ABC-type Na+ efflux pump permease subunit